MVTDEERAKLVAKYNIQLTKEVSYDRYIGGSLGGLLETVKEWVDEYGEDAYADACPIEGCYETGVIRIDVKRPKTTDEIDREIDDHQTRELIRRAMYEQMKKEFGDV